jgi:hypothetical protein
MSGQQRLLIKTSFLVAVFIFFTAVFSDFSVRMFYSSNVGWVKVLSGLLAIFLITMAIWLLLTLVPELRKAFLGILAEK